MSATLGELAAATAAAEAYRADIRRFLDAELGPDWPGVGSLSPEEYEAFRTRWRTTLALRGHLAPAWPARYGGGGRGHLESVVQAEELARRGAPRGGPNDPFSIQMIGNTLLALGTEEQKERFLPGILDGTYRFCQGFSEPGHGSDLRAVETRARREGDSWIVDGQKIWTSNATTANWCFVLCRTAGPETDRSRALTLLLVPLEQPGVEIRPIRMMSGTSEFCEVFYDGAVTAVGLEVGGEGGGWPAATRLLTFERGETTATLPVRFQAELDRLVALVRARGADADPWVRQELAWCHERVQLMTLNGRRNLARWQRGEPIGAESSVEKLFWSEYHVRATALACAVLGDDGLVYEGSDPVSYFLADEPGASALSSAAWLKVHFSALAETIAAGTSEIQRNVIAERLLGLPR